MRAVVRSHFGRNVSTPLIQASLTRHVVSSCRTSAATHTHLATCYCAGVVVRRRGFADSASAPPVWGVAPGDEAGGTAAPGFRGNYEGSPLVYRWIGVDYCRRAHANHISFVPGAIT